MSNDIDTTRPIRVFFMRDEDVNESLVERLGITGEVAKKKFLADMTAISVGFTFNKQTGAVTFIGADDRQLSPNSTVGGVVDQFV